MDILQMMCVKEVWGAELPEKEAMLIREKDRAFLEAMRDTGRMVVKDSKTGETVVLDELPKKTFDLTVMQALDRVLRLLLVGSKRFLWLLWLVTSKVDRWVRGLMSPFSTTGCATWRWVSQMEIVELECCEAMVAAMVEVGMAVGEVVSVYAGCPDISLTVTPDIKHAGRSSLVFVDLSGGHARLGGSALAQTFKQLGDVAPDCDTALLKRAFRATQRLLRERVLLAGHDRSDGGLLTRVLEMCLGGDCGCVMEATTENSVMEFLFNEELSLVVEVPARVMVKTQAANRVKVSVKGAVVVDEDEKALHDLWEATSFELDKLQWSQEGCL
ncbi:phosphoribosylformylglycinamidine synthase [Blastocystis sp. ATCC 50177/Nand II]|uniref:Phosphoribosylformylglycinamidine synthase n=1 Tax=Blastocystis sp. subtype 1 (strain ATCC 50177 / NandII) TaxID=478820 RepID=A0A196SGC3_BLAHN|nr:phosphoribosylformylglycinamidine synthase [Blastocystis sp. ATCC 50177/Nand II]